MIIGGNLMDELAVFWRVLLSIAGGIITIGGVVGVLYKVKRPFDKLRENIGILFRQNEDQDAKVDKIRREIDDEFKESKVIHEKMEREMRHYVDSKFLTAANDIKIMQRQIESMEKTIAESQEDTQLILTSLWSISNHLITGNSVDKLRDANDQIFQHLVKK